MRCSIKINVNCFIYTIHIFGKNGLNSLPQINSQITIIVFKLITAFKEFIYTIYFIKQFLKVD